MKNFNIKDFLLTTKICKNCNGLTSLYVYRLSGAGEVIDKLTQIEFDLLNNCLLLKLSSKFYRNQISQIIIDVVSHTYSMQNIDKEVSLAFSRICSHCNQFKVTSKPLFFNKQMSPLNIHYIDLIIEDKNCSYILTQTDHECKVTIVPGNIIFTLKDFQILNFTKKNLLNYINKYKILT